MENSKELSEEQFWKEVIKKHTNAFIVLIIACVCLFIGALLVVFWIIEVNPFVNPHTGGPGGTIGTFNDWTLNYVVGIIIQIILGELLFIGIPAGLFFGIGGYLWWSKLPEEEKQEFKEREKKATHRKKEYGGGGGFSFFMFIAYCIVMGLERNYNTPFGDKSYSYWIYYWFLTLMWIFIIFGIPVVIILLVLYFTKWRTKSE